MSESGRAVFPFPLGRVQDGKEFLRRGRAAVSKRPRDEDCPLVCLDEASKQLLADTQSPIPMKRGQPERGDYEYKRNGTANLFMMFAPLEGWRHIEITDRRTAIDYAHALEAVGHAFQER